MIIGHTRNQGALLINVSFAKTFPIYAAIKCDIAIHTPGNIPPKFKTLLGKISLQQRAPPIF